MRQNKCVDLVRGNLRRIRRGFPLSFSTFSRECAYREIYVEYVVTVEGRSNNNIGESHHDG